jgi:hypothetical protein
MQVPFEGHISIVRYFNVCRKAATRADVNFFALTMLSPSWSLIDARGGLGMRLKVPVVILGQSGVQFRRAAAAETNTSTGEPPIAV